MDEPSHKIFSQIFSQTHLAGCSGSRIIRAKTRVEVPTKPLEEVPAKTLVEVPAKTLVPRGATEVPATTLGSTPTPMEEVPATTLGSTPTPMGAGQPASSSATLPRPMPDDWDEL
jgi:hypothetical protein